jgi:hypothetical protein
MEVNVQEKNCCYIINLSYFNMCTFPDYLGLSSPISVKIDDISSFVDILRMTPIRTMLTTLEMFKFREHHISRCLRAQARNANLDNPDAGQEVFLTNEFIVAQSRQEIASAIRDHQNANKIYIFFFDAFISESWNLFIIYVPSQSIEMFGGPYVRITWQALDPEIRERFQQQPPKINLHQRLQTLYDNTHNYDTGVLFLFAVYLSVHEVFICFDTNDYESIRFNLAYWLLKGNLPM